MQFNNSTVDILGRVDRSSPDKLLSSLAAELALLHQANQVLLARIAAIETFQSISDRVLESDADATVELAKSVNVDAAFSLSADSGFYGLEFDSNEVPYRWTGPGPAFYFELLLDRSSPAVLTLRFMTVFMRPSPEKILRCLVDGQPVELHTRAVSGGFESRAILPPRRARGGSVVMFLCPCLQPPAAADAPRDTRWLGLAFRWLQIDRETDAGIAATDIDVTDTRSQQTEDVVKLELVQPASHAMRVSNGERVAAKMNRS
jgi:hypothetical protein